MDQHTGFRDLLYIIIIKRLYVTVKELTKSARPLAEDSHECTIAAAIDPREAIVGVFDVHTS